MRRCTPAPALRRFGGAEIRTEGDSFYVVFPSASEAVRCGLALVTAAAAATTEHPDRPIRVGVGVHAGETADTPEGYVGSAVNLAARLCAAAGAGEVLVSDTVRGLTRTSGEMAFTSRGRKQFKGIAEPIAVYAVGPAAGIAAGVGPPTKRPITTRLLGFGDPRRVVVAAGGAVVVVALATLLVAGTPGRRLRPEPQSGTGQDRIAEPGGPGRNDSQRLERPARRRWLAIPRRHHLRLRIRGRSGRSDRQGCRRQCRAHRRSLCGGRSRSAAPRDDPGLGLVPRRPGR